MRYDIKGQLFKCFNSGCGFVESLTAITYSDETTYNENQTAKQRQNDKRYVYCPYDEMELSKLKDIVDKDQKFV